MEDWTPPDDPSTPQPPANNAAGRLVTIMASARYVFLLAVICLFVSSLALLVAATVDTAQMIAGALGIIHAEHPIPLRTQALEIVDNFLVALVLIVLAFGFYQLMVAPNLPVPPWLRVRTPGEMEMKLIGVIITVAAVETLVKLSSWTGGTDLLAYGLTAAALIVVLGFYGWVHSRAYHNRDDD